MQLTRWDHYSLQIHWTGKRELNRFIGLLTFGINKEDFSFFLRGVGSRITFREITCVEIFCQRIVNGDFRLNQVIVARPDRW